MLTIVLAAALIGLLLTSGWVFQSLNEGYLKRYFLSHRALTTGYWTCGIVAMGTLLFCTVIGAFFGVYGVLAGFTLGLFVGASLATFFWNKGVKRIKLKYRAVPVWRGKRQQGAGLEMSEGLYWLFPWFFSFDAFEMKEYTDSILNIPIETKDENTVPTDVTVQWAPRAGQLYYFGNVESMLASLQPEVKSIARAFGISREDIDHLIDSNLPETLRKVEMEALKKRADGEVCQIEVDEGGNPTFTKINDAPPWGIEIRSVSVPNFTIPPDITKAAEEKTEAQKRAEASEVENQAISKITDVLVSQRNINPTAAASMAMSMVMPPDRQPKVETHNFVIGGLDDVVRTVINGVLVGLGKEPLPGMTLTPPVTSNPQQPPSASAK